MVAAMSYFLYKLIRFWQPENKELYSTTRATLTTFSTLCFPLSICLLTILSCHWYVTLMIPLLNL